jgi:p-hydroxybenzoate 3-monooxygenase
MRTQVAIIGGGPAGLLLSQILNRAGVATVVVEQRSRDYVLARVRAGVLEWGTVDMMHEAGVDQRIDTAGQVRHGCILTVDDEVFRMDYESAGGRKMMIYGQNEVTLDLYNAQDAMGATVLNECEDVALHDVTSDAPFVTFTHQGKPVRLDCDVIAGCDGFHGVSRQTIPAGQRDEFEKVYPFGWLGILARVKPVSDEVIYCGHSRGFALASMRNSMLSRYYVQVPLTDKVEDWSDEAFWAEFAARLPDYARGNLTTGPSVEKSIAPLRSFVCETMRWGRLFLAGDAAHIVPPTGAKGLNLAAGDVHYLSEALIAFFKTGNQAGIDGYATRALQRIWPVMRFSWTMTMMMHRFPDQSAFDRRIQETELRTLFRDPKALEVLTQVYTGLPF